VGKFLTEYELEWTFQTRGNEMTGIICYVNERFSFLLLQVTGHNCDCRW